MTMNPVQEHPSGHLLKKLKMNRHVIYPLPFVNFHYENMPMQYTGIFKVVKIEDYQ